MNFTLKIWRQKDSKSKGKFETYQVKDIPSDASFLEMFDILNNELVEKGEEPVAYDHDCREGICGMCSMHINGRAHGPGEGATTCQIYMRKFKDGETIWVEPWRAKAFPVIKDLMVDRTAFDKINQAGGYISVNAGSAIDADSVLVEKEHAELAMDAAACIGCGACVATCKNASAMLFVSAKVSHLAHLPQGQVEAKRRVQNMVAKMEELGFGSCTNTGACEAECPKNISISHIAKLNREFLKSQL
jgi:succinate dehydrogenase / fumarate reductase iron-sulfur subunit